MTRRKKNRSRAAATGLIPEIVGKTIAVARQEAGEFHSLDYGYEQDGPVVIEFTDGSSITIQGVWCNDSTASTGYVFRSA